MEHREEDIGKFTKNVLLYAKKSTSRAEVTSNSEKIKPVALAVNELH